MSTITIKHFSAVEYIKKLREVNFTEEQAEIVAEIFEQQQQIMQEQANEISQLKNQELATKGDIALVRGEVREAELRLLKEIEFVRRDVIQVKSDLIKWVLGTGIATILAIAGLLKFMIH